MSECGVRTLWRVEQALRQDRWTMRDLAKQLGLAYSTVGRAISVLKQDGHEIETESLPNEGRRGKPTARYWIEETQ